MWANMEAMTDDEREAYEDKIIDESDDGADEDDEDLDVE